MHKICSDERKRAMTKGCFVVMNYEEIKGWHGWLSNWYV